MRRLDPLADLASALTALDVAARRTMARLTRVEANRFNLLIVHSVAALVIGPLFVASGAQFTGPTWRVLAEIPGFPASMAAWLVAGGLITLVATIGRYTPGELVGVGMLAAWYALVAIGFGIPVAQCSVGALADVFSGRALSVPQPNLYAWAVYTHLAVIMVVHVRTLLRIGRP